MNMNDKMKNPFALLIAILLFTGSPTYSQTLKMSLDDAIAIATDSSLQAFQVKNLYLQSYWGYRSFKAARLPAVNLTLQPISYSRTILKRYDSQQDVDVYRPQQQLSSYGGLSITQNFDLTGGTFYINSGLNYIKNMGDNPFEQFNSTPVRIGYSQSLFGFNSFKWERKIEPLKYEIAKKKYIYDREAISETSTQYFFNLAINRLNYEIALGNVNSSDTLYRIGKEKFKIASITQTDLLALRLDSINASNGLKNAELQLKQSMYEFNRYLNFADNTEISLDIPLQPKNLLISIDDALNKMRENNPNYLSNRQTVMELERELDRSQKSSVFDASFDASVGFNQVATSLSKAYVQPLQQDLVSVSVSIPILDWGVRKGQVNMAKNRLNTQKFSVQQTEQSLEQELIVAVNNFNIQNDIILSELEALDMANRIYDETVEKFILGSADYNSLTLSQSRKESTQIKYITAIKNYWASYYKIRRMTLYDFEQNLSLSEGFEKELNKGFM